MTDGDNMPNGNGPEDTTDAAAPNQGDTEDSGDEPNDNEEQPTADEEQDTTDVTDDQPQTTGDEPDMTWQQPTADGEMPAMDEKMQGGFGGMGMGDSAFQNETTGSSTAMQNLIIYAVCFVILVAALVFAMLFRRRSYRR
jgi:hypothetical protein